jgi:hypothetical protein
MGYTTDFQGVLFLNNDLTTEQFEYLTKFNNTRRMKRDVNKLMELFKGEGGYPGRTGTPEEIYGNDGEYFVGGTGHAGQDRDESIIDFNTPPGQLDFTTENYNERWTQNEIRRIEGSCQPGLWCQWMIGEEVDGYVLQWDGGEKFYHYVEWLKYLIKNFFEPWGIKLDGEIEWVGEDSNDRGKIVVINNVVTVYDAEYTYVKRN